MPRVGWEQIRAEAVLSSCLWGLYRCQVGSWCESEFRGEVSEERFGVPQDGEGCQNKRERLVVGA